jgi:hypothetical protein
MTYAKICKCGHTKTDHKAVRPYNSKHEGSCEWLDCNCKKFKLKELRSTNYGAHNLPTYIDCNKPIYDYDQKIKTPNCYQLTDCDSKGHAQNYKGYHPKRFNNGEYP